MTATMKSNKSVTRVLMDWAAVIVMIAAIIIFTAVKGTSFFSPVNAINILRAMSITTIFAIGATVTMAPDGFDMSACTLASCSGYIFASTFLWWGLPIPVAVIITIIVTMVLYQLTMLLILVCHIPDMLATCALMFVHQGLGLFYTGGGAVSAGMSTRWGAAPVRPGWTTSFLAIGKSPYCIIIMLAVVIFAHIFLTYTKHGRYLYAMGGNKIAAKLSGINTTKYRYMAGMITAVIVAIGAMVVTSRNSAAQIQGCDNYLMPSLAAVFVGRSVGGQEKPNALGTLIGAALVCVLDNGLTQVGVAYYVLPAVRGAVMALALVLAYITKKQD